MVSPDVDQVVKQALSDSIQAIVRLSLTISEMFFTRRQTANDYWEFYEPYLHYLLRS
jgi:hypothetical protein